jgi:hypothetical protein
VDVDVAVDVDDQDFDVHVHVHVVTVVCGGPMSRTVASFGLAFFQKFLNI